MVGPAKISAMVPPKLGFLLLRFRVGISSPKSKWGSRVHGQIHMGVSGAQDTSSNAVLPYQNLRMYRCAPYSLSSLTSNTFYDMNDDPPINFVLDVTANVIVYVHGDNIASIYALQVSS